ncbi:hypothetical protein ELD05_00325 [Caldicellulosiruptor changbaiensis]|uniref:Phage tail sheath protein n=1 Tax=Caldicellulosiruptor changbaiensis TaxID=1222016 RepID=A0A3T0D3K0_9FIRM|nr:hypothetical protein [Caldicellulosiruptor changbaiensis]AZT89250.1 hypothetical protein ELD05_00325 [Caldicellulosiruptor changbaiensis]
MSNSNIIVDSVEVYADGTKLDTTAYTVDTTNNTVTLLENKTKGGALITIKYKYTTTDSSGATVTLSVTENGYVDSTTGQFVDFVATPQDTEFTLTYVPDATAFTLYIDGATAPTGTYTVDAQNKKVVVKGGYFNLNAKAEARYYYHVQEVTRPTIELTTKYGGYIYNRCKVKVDVVKNQAGEVIGKVVIIDKPLSKKASASELPLTYSTVDYPTFSLLVRAINNDPRNDFVEAVTEYENEPSTSIALMPETNFEGGDDGLNLSKEEIFKILSGERDENGYLVKEGIYHQLENYQVDYVVPLGVYADDELLDKNANFAYELAMCCANMSIRGKYTVGVIATRSPLKAGLADINEYANKLANLDTACYVKDKEGNIIKDADGNPVDIGKFLIIVGGPDLILKNTRFGVYTANSPAVLAGMMSALPAGASPTNKKVEGVLGLRFQFSNAQRDKILGNRIVVYKQKPNGDIVVEDGVTAARPTSDYTRISTIKSVKEAVDAIYEVTEPFIGQPNTVANRNAMSVAISKRLGQMKEAGIINDYKFNIISTLYDQLLGNVKIELTIVPAFEIRSITTIVSLKPTL